MTPETKRYLILLGAALLTAIGRILPSVFPNAPDVGTELGAAFRDIGLVMLGVPFASPGQHVVKAPAVVAEAPVSPAALSSAPEAEQ